MGSRFAVTKESPLAEATKLAIVESTESETIYGNNFDGIPARVLRTDRSSDLMKSRPFFPIVVYRAFAAARKMKIPLWKVLPGLLTQWNKMFAVAQFGAATEAIMAATVDGDLREGVQFVGQCQGMIHDVPFVDELVDRILEESREVHQRQVERYGDDFEEFKHTRQGYYPFE